MDKERTRVLIFLTSLPRPLNRPRSIYQDSSMGPSLSGLNWLGYKEKNNRYRSLTWKPRSHVRILIYRTWPIHPCHTAAILDMTYVLKALKALANEDTLLRTHCCRHKCFTVCPRGQNLLRTQTLFPGHKKCFWFCSETFCVRNKCFPVCAAQQTSWATLCPQQCVLVC